MKSFLIIKIILNILCVNKNIQKFYVEPPIGFEPMTHGLQNRCSGQLS